MTNTAGTFDRLVRSDEGATMVEYAVMLALIALVCFAAVQVVGVNTNSLFGNADLRNAL